MLAQRWDRRRCVRRHGRLFPLCRSPAVPPPPPAAAQSRLAACLSLPAQVALSSFAYLFSELVQYCQSRVSNVGELERK